MRFVNLSVGNETSLLTCPNDAKWLFGQPLFAWLMQNKLGHIFEDFFVSRTRLVLFFDVCNNDSQIIFRQKVIFLRFIFLRRKPHRGILYGVMLLYIQDMFSFFSIFFCRIDPFGSEGNSKGDNCPTKRIFLAFLLCDFSPLMSNFPTYVLCSPVCPINIFISDLN